MIIITPNKKSTPNQYLVWCAFLLVTFLGCKKGNQKDNEPPETQLFVREINLDGENRLRTSVFLEWYGLDPDGYVTHYEYSLDKKDWFKTERTDSTFVFAIPRGKQVLDQSFYIRAVDQLDAVDETPAQLTVPLKNTPPTIRIDSSLTTLDTAFIVTSLSWIAEDLDGESNLSYIEVKANDGDWYRLSPSQTFMSLIPQSPKQSSTQNGTVYLEGGSPEDEKLQGLEVGGLNNFHIRAVDISGASSGIDTLRNIFIKPQIHDNLLLGEWSFHNATNQNLLASTGVSFDFIDMEANNGANQPKFWNPAFQLYLSNYDFVMLYSGNGQYNNIQTGAQEYFLESAASGIQEYLSGGGKMLISSALPVLAAGTGQTYSFLQVLPIDSIATESISGSFNTNADSLIKARVSGYPDLKTKSFKIYGDEFSPFNPTSDAIELYRAQLETKNGWDGPYSVAALRRNSGGLTNQVFFGLPLHELGRTQSNIDAVMNQLIKQEFNR